ncbi:MAG: hypothetical protein FJ217_00800 [Ignavibacteria bacterium]|nr:hypothetical protein [Ignavibacteria bacterium]
MTTNDSFPHVGLCERCRHSTIITSAHESRFYLCELSAADQSYPKYPRLPVLRCPGFEERDPAPQNERSS